MSLIHKVFKYGKGQKLRLDDIYDYQNLTGDWWDFDGVEGGEDIIITKDIDVDIIIQKIGLEIKGKIEWRIMKEI